MNLTLVPVTEQNRAQAEKLSVCPGQEHFIETVAECLSEADTLSEWEPVCIQDGEKMVGFAMYGLIHEPKYTRVWFDRFLIDGSCQHHGYGRQAVRTILHQLRKEFPGENIYLSAYEDNQVAISLYASFGFRFNGELDINGEKVMVLPAAEVPAE